ncbi:hypothetical protein LZ554_005867 [Drepanopeziza brunnea f. sp. 'monogermtubi']|nr:hypothetical protein LZ554_005867 [Drepanopeziza brunnea f. sp. 'monogermtubi']
MLGCLKGRLQATHDRFRSVDHPIIRHIVIYIWPVKEFYTALDPKVFDEVSYDLSVLLWSACANPANEDPRPAVQSPEYLLTEEFIFNENNNEENEGRIPWSLPALKNAFIEPRN